jgi:hypothetical protein
LAQLCVKSCGWSHVPPSFSASKPLQVLSSSSLPSGWTWMEHNKKIPRSPSKCIHHIVFATVQNTKVTNRPSKKFAIHFKGLKRT